MDVHLQYSPDYCKQRQKFLQINISNYGIVNILDISMIVVFNMEDECAMNCPKCGSIDCTKDGIVKGKQRGIGAATKREALQL
jgi:hypothetical protein